MKFKLTEPLVVVGDAVGNGAYGTSRYLYRSIKRESFSQYSTEVAGRQVLSEGIDFSFDDANLGGTIVFSTDVNAEQMSKNKIVNWVKQKIATINNRLSSTGKIDAVAQKHDLAGWTISKGLSGRYTAKNGKAFGENSIAVDIVGITHDELIDIATELCNLFLQEAVLVKDYSTKKVYLINGD